MFKTKEAKKMNNKEEKPRKITPLKRKEEKETKR